MIRSMFADQPYSDVVSTQGESAMRELIKTFSTLSPKTSFMSLLSGSNSALSSSNFFFSSSSSMSRPSLVIDFSFFPIKLLQLLDGVLVHWVHHVQHLQALLPERLQERRGRHSCEALASDVINVILTFFHPVDVFLQTDVFIARLGGLVAHKLSNLGSVCGVLMNTELQALAELLIKLLIVILLLADLLEHLQALLHEVLLDDAEDLVLLQRLPGDVQRQVLRIDHTLNEVEPLWHQLLAVIHDEHTADIQLDVAALLLRLEHVERGATRNKEQGAELELTFDGEVLDGQMILPIIGQGLVEGCILFIGDILRGLFLLSCSHSWDTSFTFFVFFFFSSFSFSSSTSSIFGPSPSLPSSFFSSSSSSESVTSFSFDFST